MTSWATTLVCVIGLMNVVHGEYRSGGATFLVGILLAGLAYVLGRRL